MAKNEKANGEITVAVLLLASAAAFPAVVRDWFTELRRSEPQSMFALDAAIQCQSVEWERFKSLLNRTLAQAKQLLTKELFSKWLDRVERFGFATRTCGVIRYRLLYSAFLSMSSRRTF